MNYYGVAGRNSEMESPVSPGAGYVLMTARRPTLAHTAKADGTWELNVADQRLALKDRLALDFSRACDQVTAGWPADEIKTWTVQNDEARQWTAAAAEDKPATPLLTALYQNRVSLGWEEPFEKLVLRVIDNSDKYTAAIARLIAIRHVTERKIEEATDPSTVTWSF